MKRNNVSVTFVKNQHPYQEGEVAGFSDRIARNFVENGIAVYTEEVPKEKEEAAPKVERKRFSGENKQMIPEEGKGYKTKAV